MLIDEAWSSSPGLYIIVSGETRIERRDGSERVLLTMRKAGDAIGELSLLDGRPPSATVVAASDVEALLLPMEDFSRTLDTSPALCRELIRMLVGRLREETDTRVVIQTKDVSGRVAAEILQVVKRQAPGQATPVVRLEMSQAELGQKIGASRESINKSLKRLQVGNPPPLEPVGRQRRAFRVNVSALQTVADVG